jgi:hypothetical protein
VDDGLARLVTRNRWIDAFISELILQPADGPRGWTLSDVAMGRRATNIIRHRRVKDAIHPLGEKKQAPGILGVQTLRLRSARARRQLHA